jgi:hypothetical protein
VLVAACAAVRAAVAAYNAEAERDEPGAELAALFERERLALECVAATRARTPLGIAEKAMLIDACPESPETVDVALSLADDAVALVWAMVGAGAAGLADTGSRAEPVARDGAPPGADRNDAPSTLPFRRGFSMHQVALFLIPRHDPHCYRPGAVSRFSAGRLLFGEQPFGFQQQLPTFSQCHGALFESFGGAVIRS